jgi:anti-sigma factor RsiW
MRRHSLWRRAVSRQVDCRHVGAWLQSYLDGELDDARHRDVARHLKDCRRCGMEASTYRALKASVRRSVPTLEETASLHRLREFAERLAAGAIDLPQDADGAP